MPLKRTQSIYCWEQAELIGAFAIFFYHFLEKRPLTLFSLDFTYEKAIKCIDLNAVGISFFLPERK